jgi:hypothetical protein
MNFMRDHLRTCDADLIAAERMSDISGDEEFPSVAAAQLV